MTVTLLLDFLLKVLAGITVAGLSGAVGYFFRGDRERRKISEAPFVYVKRLDELILRALREGPRSAVINARAIVAARNSLARSLVSMSSQLNSEIDRLAEEIQEKQFMPAELSDATKHSERQIDPERAFETIQVLERIWPAKRSQIMVEVRKLMAELGLAFDLKHEDHFQDWWRP